MGRSKRPFFRVVAIDSRTRRDGSELERLGWYDPLETSGEKFSLNEERIFYWLGTGAKPSDTVKNLLSEAGLGLKWHLMRNGKSSEEIEAAIKDWESTRSLRERRREALDAQKQRTKEPVEAKAETEPEAEAEAEAKAEAEVDEVETEAKTEEAPAEVKGEAEAEAKTEAKAETEEVDSETKTEEAPAEVKGEAEAVEAVATVTVEQDAEPAEEAPEKKKKPAAKPKPKAKKSAAKSAKSTKTKKAAPKKKAATKK